MYSNNRYQSGKPRRIEAIRPRIDRLFGSPLCRAKDLNVSVKINITPVIDARGLAGEIAKRRLENDRATLGLFLKAINVTNKAAKAMDKSNVYYLLNLGKLLPKNLTSLTPMRKANLILKTKDQKVAIRTLTEMNALYQVLKWESSFPPSNEI
jgi:hypothetical protein